MITSVSEGYGAEGKLEMGDIIVEVDGIKTSTIYDVMGIANNKRAGDTLRVKFYRDGAYSTVDIVLMPEQ
jgi:S1-C subfamily serine protease